MQCTSDFQFRDILVKSLGNFKGLSRRQSSDIANIQEELEKSFKSEFNVSPAGTLDECETEYHYQDASFTLNLAAL